MSSVLGWLRGVEFATGKQNKPMKRTPLKFNSFSNRLAFSLVAFLATTAVSSFASDYPTTVSSLNPVGYWRLNGAAAVPRGDVATNSGSLYKVSNCLLSLS